MPIPEEKQKTKIRKPLLMEKHPYKFRTAVVYNPLMKAIFCIFTELGDNIPPSLNPLQNTALRSYKLQKFIEF